MKKNYILRAILVLFFVLTCVALINEVSQTAKTQEKDKTLAPYNNCKIDAYYGANIFTIEYDSCEYVMYGEKRTLTHKGNCKFCQGRKDKENTD